MLHLKIENMTCKHCIGAVTNAIQHVQADAQVDVDLSTKRVSIDSKLGEQEVIQR